MRRIGHPIDWKKIKEDIKGEGWLAVGGLFWWSIPTLGGVLVATFIAVEIWRRT